MNSSRTLAMVHILDLNGDQLGTVDTGYGQTTWACFRTCALCNKLSGHTTIRSAVEALIDHLDEQHDVEIDW